jgi:hypothetical protein
LAASLEFFPTGFQNAAYLPDYLVSATIDGWKLPIHKCHINLSEWFGPCISFERKTLGQGRLFGLCLCRPLPLAPEFPHFVE